jgi:hypothetical protein
MKTDRPPCTLDNCGHMRQLDAIVDLLRMARGTRSVLDELHSRLRCEHAGMTLTFSGDDPRQPQQSGRVQWCTRCGSIRYEQSDVGQWSWCHWMRPSSPMPEGPQPPTE